MKRLLLGLSKKEFEKYQGAIEQIGSLNDLTDQNLNKEVEMAVMRDIQAQRLPPNVQVPSRRQVLQYLDIMQQNTGSLNLAIRSWLSSGSWTTSGGSFKLAEDAGWRLAEGIGQDYEKPTVLEVGAGYAGFLTEKGLAKMYQSLRDSGEETDLHFTNLTEWFDEIDLPEGVTEHPGILARNVASLQDELGGVDLVYSQCAAYFDDKIEEFVAGVYSMLNDRGYLFFNAPESKAEAIMEAAGDMNLVEKVSLGGENGDFYGFRRLK
ncbi:hypothetical protein HOC80_02815 [archaeon]|jgi:hypothetical protein|nr:hypothetical protein [archaeon]MBT4417013.1 hypothetical protein [archaeon]